MLPTVNHTFLPGHRIMVQIQSTWFPLYDRNPQSFVPNIFFANAPDYVNATDSEPYVSSRAPDHGADPVHVVSAVRSQSAELCAEYLFRQCAGLRESYRQ